MHVCNLKRTTDGYNCKDCGKFVSYDQAGIALSYGMALFGEISEENKEKIKQTIENIINTLSQRHAMDILNDK